MQNTGSRLYSPRQVPSTAPACGLLLSVPPVQPLHEARGHFFLLESLWQRQPRSPSAKLLTASRFL